MVRYCGVGFLAASFIAVAAAGALASQTMAPETEAAGTEVVSVAGKAREVVRWSGTRVCQVPIVREGATDGMRIGVEFRNSPDASLNERMNFHYYCQNGGDVVGHRIHR